MERVTIGTLARSDRGRARGSRLIARLRRDTGLQTGIGYKPRSGVILDNVATRTERWRTVKSRVNGRVRRRRRDPGRPRELRRRALLALLRPSSPPLNYGTRARLLR